MLGGQILGLLKYPQVSAYCSKGNRSFIKECGKPCNVIYRYYSLFKVAAFIFNIITWFQYSLTFRLDPVFLSLSKYVGVHSPRNLNFQHLLLPKMKKVRIHIFRILEYLHNPLDREQSQSYFNFQTSIISSDIFNASQIETYESIMLA